MHFRLKLWLVAAAALIVASGAAHGFSPRVAYDASDGSVQINGRTVVRFRVSNGSLSPGERAKITGERLGTLVSAGLSPSAVYMKGDKWQARVMVGESLICIATPAEAKAGRTTPLALAASWVRNIRSALALPAIVLSDKELVVPLGENRRVYVSGAATGPLYAASQATDVAVASPGTDGRYIQVTGQQTGHTTVDISSEGEHAVVDVWVKKYAGALPRVGYAEVTGAPCPPHLLEYAARQSVLRDTVAESGASVRIEGVSGADSALQPGTTRDVTLKMTISGEGYIPVSGQANVQVHNALMPRDEVTQLFYSNNPERLLKYQTLFAGKLELDKATRILYHHQNAIGRRARFLVEVINPNATPIALRVMKGVSSPMVDTVLVGYVAGGAFMRDEYANASVIDHVPAQSRLVLVSDDLGNLETSSGIIQLKQTEGQPAYVRVAAVPPGSDDARVGAITPTSNVVALEISDHVYPKPLLTMDAAYVIGERWAFIPIGRHAISDTAEQKKLFGNYGVTYNINVKVANPTAETRKVSVLFEATAGLASGVFIIDGEFVSAKYAKPPAEVPLASYQLKPGESRNVRIVTMPMSGSNYPATLVVRS